VTKLDPTVKEDVFDETGFETVYEGARIKVVFDIIGDRFRGIYLGTEEIVNPNTGEIWTQSNFHGMLPSELAGQPVAINAGTELTKTLAAIPVGKEVDITLVRLVKTSKQEPMKSYRVLQRDPQ
jgi:hypothetical protein